MRTPRQMELARLQDAITGAFANRGWDVQGKGSDHVVGHIKSGSKEAVLAVVFNADLIQLYCEGWKIDRKTGAHIKPSLPDGWIDNIRKDLAARLAIASPSF